jgi:hypothetical protein
MTRPFSSLALVVNHEGLSEAAAGAAGGGALGAAGVANGAAGVGTGAAEAGTADAEEAAPAAIATHTVYSPIAARVYPAFCTLAPRSPAEACFVACW